MRRRLTPMVKNLILINVGVFILIYALPYLGINTAWLANNLALYYPASENFQPVQLVTHIFMHGGLTHIFMNMFGLFIFGPLLEMHYGPRRFLLLYFVAAAGAVALHFGFTWYDISRMQDMLAEFAANPTLANFDDFFRGVNARELSVDDGQRLSRVLADLQNALVLQTGDVAATRQQAAAIMQEYIDFQRDIPMVGASGAIYGLVAAFTILFPNIPLMIIFLPIPIKARYLLPAILVIELFLGFMQYSWDPIAHFAHIGGALAGGLLAYVWYKIDPPAGARRWN